MYKLPNGLSEFEDCESYSTQNPLTRLHSIFNVIAQTKWLKNKKKEFKPDLTVSTLFSCSAFNVLSRGKDLKIGIFHSPHYQAKAQGVLAYSITLFYYKFLFPHLDRLYCVSREVANSIRVNFPNIKPSKVSVVYNAHDLNKIQRLAKEQIIDKNEIKIFSKPVILYIGRFDSNKAPERAINAFAELKCKNEVNLVFIGEKNDYSKNVKSLVREKGLSEHVFFLGYKQNPYKYLCMSSALISCSYSEGLPGVIIEAQLLGVPVVSTNSSEGIWEIFSCETDYDKNLNSLYRTKYGIITSNIGNTELDINNLSKGMSEIIQHPRFNPFENGSFIEKVKFENISKYYLE